MKINYSLPSFRRRPESSGFNSLLDPGLRRDDGLDPGLRRDDELDTVVRRTGSKELVPDLIRYPV